MQFHKTTKYYKYNYSSWTQPVLTSNTSSTVMQVFAYEQYSNDYQPWKSFKEKTTDRYGWGHNRVPTTDNPADYYIFTTDKIKISKITMKNRTHNDVKAIKTGSFQGFDPDLNIWVNLATINNTNNTSAATWTITVNQVKPYTRFRFYITSSNGSGINLSYPTITATKVTSVTETTAANADFSQDVYSVLGSPNKVSDTTSGFTTMEAPNGDYGILHDFGQYKYAVIPPPKEKIESIDFHMHFQTGSAAKTNYQAVTGQLVSQNTHAPQIEITANNAGFALVVGTGSAWGPVIRLTYDVQNKYYYLARFTWNSTDKILKFTVWDDSTKQVIAEGQTTQETFDWSTPMTLGNDQEGTTAWFNGEINLLFSQCYINGKPYWVGERQVKCRSLYYGCLPYNGVVLHGDTGYNNGIISGFKARRSYARLYQNFRPGSKPWEVVVKFRYTETPVSNTCIFADYLTTNQGGTIGGRGFSVNLRTADKTIQFQVSTDDKNFDFTVNGKTALTKSVWYWAKLEYTGTAYTISISTDGENYTEEATYASTTPFSQSVNNKKLCFGRQMMGWTNNYFRGEIDLNESYVKMDGAMWWDGSLSGTDNMSSIETI